MSTITLTLPAPIGAELGGGIYVGPHFQPDRSVRHLVAAPESLGDHKWEAAQVKAKAYRGGGFDDWFLPDTNALTVALLNARDKFDKAIHWTSTPYGSDYAWAVDFEYGSVLTFSRSSEFRVRPFRVHQFIPSSLSPAEAERLIGGLPADELSRMQAATDGSPRALSVYQAFIYHTQPARAMLELITSTGGDTAFDGLEPEQQQAYLHALFHHVASVDDVLRDIGGAKS